MSSVQFKGLTKIYSGFGKQSDVMAVKAIDLEIHDHEFMVLVGPSGCGKSTTLRMLAGLEKITQGDCFIGNKRVNKVLPKDRDIAMVFQNYALYPHMTVFENMAFGLKIQKMPKDEIRARVLEASEILGLNELLDRKPKALSGGQRQRVAVGRAIVRKPKVFLFDEPLSNLDAKMRVQMRTEISKLHARLDATMIYVTHDQVEAMTMGDRICVMRDGEIMQVDEPLDLYNHPQNVFVAGFIGSPSMNFFTGRIATQRDGLVFIESVNGADGFLIYLDRELAARASPYENREIILGIRPENLVHKTAATAGSPFNGLSAKIEVSEPMGSETYLYLHSGLSEFVARVQSTHSFGIGNSVQFEMDQRKVHFFDPVTEKVIETPAVSAR